MKYTLFTLGIAGLMSVSCGKKDKKSAPGPNPIRPSLDLVGPSGFKNTAKNASEVGANFKNVGSSASKVHFGSSQKKNESKPEAESNSVLNLDGVKSFLALSNAEPGATVPSGPINFPDRPNMPTTDDSFNDGSNCASQLDKLDTVYKSAAKGLQQTAETLEKFDGNLPEGTTKGESNDQFAVTYTSDLSKLSRPETSEDEKLSLTGLAVIGAGANDNTAVISVGIDASASTQSNFGTFKGGIAAAAYTKEQLLKLKTNASINATTKAQDGSPINARTSFNALMALQAGANPSLELAFTGSANGTPNGSNIKLTNEDHALIGSMKLVKLSNSDISITYKFTVDSKNTEGKLNLTTNAEGQCVVKNSGNNPDKRPSVLSQ